MQRSGLTECADPWHSSNADRLRASLEGLPHNFRAFDGRLHCTCGLGTLEQELRAAAKEAIHTWDATKQTVANAAMVALFQALTPGRALPGEDETPRALTAPIMLIAEDACVVCFHDAHPEGGSCAGFDPGPDGDVPCGCTEYVTEEERGRIVVRAGEGEEPRPPQPDLLEHRLRSYVLPVVPSASHPDVKRAIAAALRATPVPASGLPDTEAFRARWQGHIADPDHGYLGGDDCATIACHPSDDDCVAALASGLPSRDALIRAIEHVETRPVSLGEGEYELSDAEWMADAILATLAKEETTP